MRVIVGCRQQGAGWVGVWLLVIEGVIKQKESVVGNVAGVSVWYG